MNQQFTDSQVTAATCPLMLNEKEYQASPLSDRDFAELDEWIQSKIISMARASCVGLSKAERQETLQAAMQAAVGISLFSEEGSAMMQTPEGIARLAWQMLRKKHPQLHHQDVMKFTTDPTNLENIILVFSKLNSDLLGSDEEEVTSKNEEGAASNQ